MKSAQAFIATAMRRTRKLVPTRYAWGYNWNNILAVSPAGSLSSPILAETKVWTKVVSDGYYSVGLTSDGALWSWGTDVGNNGIFGNGTIGASYSSPIRIGTSYWVDIANNFEAALAIRTDGTLWGWGRNYHDVFPTNANSDVAETPIYLGSGTWASISMNYSEALAANTIAIQTSGTGYCFGYNDAYQFGLGDNNLRSAVSNFPSTAWKNASVGVTHAMGVKTNGTLWAWGNAVSGSFGNGVTTATDVSTPVQVGVLTTWASVTAGYQCALMLRAAGTLWFTGVGADGTSGLGAVTDVSTPLQVGAATNWAKVSMIQRHALGRQSDGTIWSWGLNSNGQIGNSTATAGVSTPVKIGALTSWADVSAGYDFSAAIQTDGSLWAWGNNFDGQLGVGTTTNVSSPVRVGVSTWLKVAAGNRFTAAVKADGTVWVWGFIGGFRNTINVSTPVQLNSETVWTDVRVGYQCVLMLKNDGSVWTIGSNAKGQLGSSTEANFSTPVQMGTDTTWKKISFKDFAGVGALKSDGTIWNWGWLYPYDDQLIAIYRVKTPIQLGTGIDWANIEAVAGNVMALKSNGTLWSWGLNRDKGGFPLGKPSTSSPMQVGSATSWKQFAMCTTSTFAIRTDGTLWSWGTNTNGEVGRGTADGSSPAQIGALTSWASVYARYLHAHAIRTDGTLWGWGLNGFGHLGDGTLVNKSTPVQIGLQKDWVKIFSGLHSTSGRRDR